MFRNFCALHQVGYSTRSVNDEAMHSVNYDAMRQEHAWSCVVKFVFVGLLQYIISCHSNCIPCASVIMYQRGHLDMM